MPGVLVATCFRIPHVGGASTHVEALVGGLRRRGLPVTLVAGRSGWSRLSPLRMVRRALYADAARTQAVRDVVRELGARIARGLARAGPDEVVVHAHDPLGACAALRLHPRPGAIVLTVHGILSREAAGVMRGPSARYRAEIEALEREAFAGVDRVVAISGERAVSYVGELGLDPARVVVIPNAVDVDVLAAMPALAEPGNEVVVPRRLTPVAGVEVALAALAQLPHPRPRLVVAGDGPLRPALRAQVRRLGLEGDVELAGALAHGALMARLRRARAVVVPSVAVQGAVEGTSIAALEAMAIGVPVVASELGGLAEILAGGCGVLVPPGDAAALAAALREVLALGPAARRALVERARHRVRERHGVEGWIDATLRTYAAARRGALPGERVAPAP